MRRTKSNLRTISWTIVSLLTIAAGLHARWGAQPLRADTQETAPSTFTGPAGHGSTADRGAVRDGIGVSLPAVTGTVTYQERIALPSDATVTVDLVDVFLPDLPLTVAEQRISPAGQVPIPFSVAYDPSAIDPKHPYTVEVSIMDGKGQLLFTNMDAYSVMTQGNPTSDIQVVVGRV